jgi:hypothetical protein
MPFSKLDLLGRTPRAQKLYDERLAELRREYGVPSKIVLSFLQIWGFYSLLAVYLKKKLGWSENFSVLGLGSDMPLYFTATAPSDYIRLVKNDWPYSGRSPLSQNKDYRTELVSECLAMLVTT